MSTAVAAAEQRVVLQPVSWPTYRALADEAKQGRGRICYYRGVLEIMSPSKSHEQISRLIGRLIETFTEESAIEVCSVASTTFRREDLQAGFEADESYYLGEVAGIVAKEEIDLSVDRPPDLVVEVDISRSSLAKLALYGELRVPEVWRFDGARLRMYVYRGEGGYAEVEQSARLAPLTVAALMRFLDMRFRCGETQIIREFRDWIRNPSS